MTRAFFDKMERETFANCFLSLINIVIKSAKVISAGKMVIDPFVRKIIGRLRRKINRIQNRTRTLLGNDGFNIVAIIGSVIKMAIAVEEIKVAETTIGMDLINSPMIPVESSRGTNAQTAVIVVDQIGRTKSLSTKRAVWFGVKRFVRQ